MQAGGVATRAVSPDGADEVARVVDGPVSDVAVALERPACRGRRGTGAFPRAGAGDAVSPGRVGLPAVQVRACGVNPMPSMTVRRWAW